MALNYQEFKDYLVTFLWKANDTQLINSLDNLIRMGTSQLNRDLDIEKRHKSVNLIVDNQRMALPADYYAMRQVVDLETKLGEFLYVTPAELETARDRIVDGKWAAIYSLEDNEILFVGPNAGGRQTTGEDPPPNPQEGDIWNRTTVAPGQYQWTIDPTSAQWVQIGSSAVTSPVVPNPKNIVIHYKSRIPDHQATNASWLTDDFLDLYSYAVLYHTAPFLREDERVQQWQAMYKQALDAAMQESAHAQVRGINAPLPLPTPASPLRYRSTYARR